MMLYPPVAELVDKIGSRYQLVNLVARRARELSAEAEENETPLERKPVSSAIDEVYTGKLTITKKEEA
ncbi:MAG: DNA-directed RNA polymerase subunit omega [Oscillospiraceae bacterium]|nr:DNA-directed RNA polymerase subunit omega [Oscillospiraceae bacterium]